MGQYKFVCLIEPKTGADYKVVNTVGASRPALLELVGSLTSEQILLQYPLNDDPDETNEAHWAPRQLNDEVQALRAGHTSIAVPVNMLIRIVKPVTSSAVGVRFA